MKKELERRKQGEIKREPFIKCHPPLQALLHSSYVLSSLLQELKEMENTKEEEEEQLT